MKDNVPHQLPSEKVSDLKFWQDNSRSERKSRERRFQKRRRKEKRKKKEEKNRRRKTEDKDW